MSREYQTDSGLLVNETGTRQAQTDIGLFINESVTTGGNGGNGGNGGSGVPITEMTFINGAGVDFATGRIVANVATGVPSDADMSHSIGLLYDNDPSPNALQFNDVGAASSYGIGGIMVDGYGQMLVTTTEPVGTPIFNDGLWVTPAGLTVVTTTDSIAGYSHGWPVSVKGAVCVVEPGTGTGGGGLNIFVYDTFTGSDTLSTHIGEIGATWSWEDFNQLSAIALSGGSIHTTTSGLKRVYASGVSTTASYSLETSYTRVLSGSGVVELIGRFTLNGNLISGYISFVVVLSTGVAQLKFRPDYLGTETLVIITSFTSSILTPHVLRLDIDDAAQTASAYFDEVLLGSHTITGIAPTIPGKVGFLINGGTSNLTMDYFKAYETIP